MSRRIVAVEWDMSRRFYLFRIRLCDVFVRFIQKMCFLMVFCFDDFQSLPRIFLLDNFIISYRIRQTMNEGGIIVLLDHLNNEQREAVTHFDSPLLILAGAGSGKTRVITHKIAYRISKGVLPSKILAVTFTNKAANEMKERVAHLIPNADVRNMWIGTFHSMCLRILKIHADKVGLTRYFTVYDRDDQFALVKSVFKDLNIAHEKSDIYTTLNGISAAKQQFRAIRDLYNEDGYGGPIIKIADAYEKRLLDANAVDFDNIIFHTVVILNSYPDIRDHYEQLFDYVLVDEYQDTNHIQFRLIQLLTGSKGNICVVGDEDQSIYSWRGANIENIIGFEKQFHKAHTIKLEQNYRSTKTILEAANHMIGHNTERKGKNLWTDNDVGVPIVVYEKETKEDESEAIARECVSLARNGSRYRDIAVFVRVNAQTREIERALRRVNLPYVVIGSLAFYERKEIKDIMAYLKVLANPRDIIALERIINIPKRGIGDASVKSFTDGMKNEGRAFYDYIEHGACDERIKKKVMPFYVLMKEAKLRFDSQPLVESLHELLKSIEYEHYVKDEFENPEERWENVQALADEIGDYEANNPGSILPDYLSDISLYQDIDRLDETADAVNVLTIHKAKGLEYDTVFISGVEDGVLPHRSSFDSPGGVEEERRLFYVAMTRARKKLYISWSRTNKSYTSSYGTIMQNSISRFFKEIPAHYLQPQTRKPIQSAVRHTSTPSSTTPSSTVPTTASKPLKTGTRISHPEYGEGMVIANKFKTMIVSFGTIVKEIDPQKDEVTVL